MSRLGCSLRLPVTYDGTAEQSDCQTRDICSMISQMDVMQNKYTITDVSLYTQDANLIRRKGFSMNWFMSSKTFLYYYL